MKETEVLDKTLEALDACGASAAYRYLSEQAEDPLARGSQTYNFLYCLAAASGLREEALAWLEEAVVERGFWYRPEVFLDEDLDSIREDARFLSCEELSRGRYEAALIDARTLCTWREKTGERLALCLHGNQQNAEMAADAWAFLPDHGWQTTYVQSRSLDSCGLYRWEDGDAPQLPDVIATLPWSAYEERMLCGFSSGCNEILRSLPFLDGVPERITLVSPWIPDFEGQADPIVRALQGEKTRVLITCGTTDEDCLPLARMLYQRVIDAGIEARLDVIDGLGHAYPADLDARVNR